MTRLLYTFFLPALSFGLILFGFAPSVWGAPDFTPLVGIPGVTNFGNKTSLPEYLNAVYKVIVSVGALYGVVKIGFAGFKYIMSDVITDKGTALDDIKGVLLGIGMLLIPYIVLNTINPDLTSLKILDEAKKVELKPSRSISNNPQAPNGSSFSSQIAECTSRQNSMWDYTCNTCILRSQSQGSACGQTSSGNQRTTACQSFSFTPPATQATIAGLCQTQCNSMGGTFSSQNLTCTYGSPRN